MSTPADLANVQQTNTTNAQAFVMEAMPPIPDEVKQRFPSMIQYEEDMKEWFKNFVFNTQQALTGVKP